MEPNPFVYRTLELNAGLNVEKMRIVPLNFAAMPEDGEYTFEYSDPSYCNGGLHRGMSRWKHAHAFPLKVQGKCLESYLEREHPECLPRLRYIKTDLEGFDYEVLLSLRPLLERTRPYIKAEIYKHAPEKTRVDMLELFTTLDYTVYHIESEAEYRGERVTPDNVNQWRHYDIFCVPNAAEG
ncbi:MAG: FkbM family methyltransferase [Candidatus Hydrogenedentota bacterium]